MAFRPTRSSSPAKVSESLLASTLSAADASRSSTVSIRELVGLTPSEVELLDAIVERAGSATTFPAIFTAYNAVLKERGLNTSEVVFYGKLLKLGTLKGSWADKWRMIKLQQGYVSQKPTKHIPPTRLRRPVTDDSDDERHPRRAPSPFSDFTSVSRQTPPARSRLFARDTDATSSDATEQIGAPSTTPPSYRAAMREKADDKPTASALARQRIAQARQRGGSVVNAADTWKKLKMESAEADAIKFHEDRLLERCWQVWRAGYEWIVDTDAQVAEARNNHVIRLCIHKWRLRTAASQDRFASLVHLADVLRLRRTFSKWKLRSREKRQARWRTEMRAKMKIIRGKRERKVLTQTLQRWKQASQTRIAVRHHTYSLLYRYFSRWKQATVRLDQLDGRADQFSLVVDRGVVERAWYYWKHASQLQLGYRIVTENVALRVKTEVMDTWKSRLGKLRIADDFYAKLVQKHAIRAWKSARRRLRALDHRVNVHSQTRETSLVRAAYKTIKTKYLGRKLEWMTDNRRLREAWNVWKDRIRQQQRLEANALAFSQRPSSYLAEVALRKWYQAHARHKKAHLDAAFCDAVLVRRTFYFAWKAQVERQRVEATKAVAIHKRFLLRSAWVKIRLRFAERQRQLALEVLELRKTQRVFYAWFERAYRRRTLKVAEQEIHDRVVQRILKNTLLAWTNRTIDVKNREFQVTLDRDTWLLKNAFKKWKIARSSHAEQLRLMESYGIVKREGESPVVGVSNACLTRHTENLRKYFHRWLSAARTTARRRVTLERKEAEMHFSVKSVAWDKWRYRFKQQRLQPLEDAMILQHQRNALVRAFSIWHGKTKSSPAIQFHASHLKAKYWKTWLAALPRALQGKDANTFRSKSVLSKSLSKWVQLYRTKAALKAVARARYMRLPTTRTNPRVIAAAPVSRATMKLAKKEGQYKDWPEDLVV
ncbi:CTLH domain-containing protein [Mycena indigotica]|uniref:CTLH domain-containing protein n=1 Tax=Mycena indigotica TaxID=2126181 RepID=A0A8H6S9S1_9AGAR|nr:CTLH domain-containing protein [Mycena indigotica]KAF7294982.1 CTLH domain-containing protein [Mycena indigotica]